MYALMFFFCCLHFSLTHKNREPKVKFDETRTLIVAHRGLTSVHLENTLAAFTSAFEAGADGVEFDVQLTRDLMPMVFHDRELARLVGVNNNIDDLSLEELRGLRQKSDRYAMDYPISTLEEVLTAMPEGKLINIELKETTGMKGALGMAKVLEVIAPFKHKLKIVISSFDAPILAMVDAQDPDYALGFLIDKVDTLLAYMNGRGIVDRVDFINPHIDLVDEKTSKWIKDRGVKLIFWGQTRLGEEDKFMSDNHTALISDVTVDLLQKYRK